MKHLWPMEFTLLGVDEMARIEAAMTDHVMNLMAHGQSVTWFPAEPVAVRYTDPSAMRDDRARLKLDAPWPTELKGEWRQPAPKPHPLQRVADQPSVFGQSMWRPWE